MTKVAPIDQRKADHIKINLEQDVRSALSSGLEKYRFIHEALPELDLDFALDGGTAGGVGGLAVAGATHRGVCAGCAGVGSVAQPAPVGRAGGESGRDFCGGDEVQASRRRARGVSVAMPGIGTNTGVHCLCWVHTRIESR